MFSLEAVGLTQVFGTRTVVDRLSFRVTSGQMLGLLGPNGAGKTTTFRMIAGLLKATNGTFRLNDEDMTTNDSRLRSCMGVVFQHASLDVKMTAKENLMMGARLYGLSASEARERTQWGLEFVELSSRSNDLVETFSGGMRRRLELARVLLHQPSFLLLDEPTQGLDIAAKERIWTQLLTLKKHQQLAMILTTHSAEEAEYCDSLLVLNRGKTVAYGSPTELRTRVGGEIVALDIDGDPASLLPLITERLAVQPRVLERQILIEHEDSRALIPRIFEALPHGHVRGLSVRRPSLADVFLKLTGQTFESADIEAAQPPTK